MKPQKFGSITVACYREKGYIAQPIPTPISKNKNNDQIMYFTRSLVRRRLRNPNATEMSSAKSVIA
jgi:hypothetical protein